LLVYVIHCRCFWWQRWQQLFRAKSGKGITYIQIVGVISLFVSCGNQVCSQEISTFSLDVGWDVSRSVEVPLVVAGLHLLGCYLSPLVVGIVCAAGFYGFVNWRNVYLCLCWKPWRILVITMLLQRWRNE